MSTSDIRPLEGIEKPIEKPIESAPDTRVWGSDMVAEAMRNIDLEYVSLNPGASFRGLHDSLVNYNGNRKPQMLLCVHEENAVSIAHGYAKVKGRPMGVILHSNVGLLHGSMGIFNAWCDRVPMVVLGATGPVDANKRRPWIDWIHTSNDQGGAVRNFTKWDDQPASVPAAIEAISRANQIANTAPKGPVYVNLDVSLQEQRIEGALPLPDQNRFKPSAPPAPDPDALDEAITMLSSSKKIVVLMGRVSRSTDDWRSRIAFAEKFSAQVVTDLKLGAAFPLAHELHLGPPSFYLEAAAAKALADADLIVSLDWVDLAGALKQSFAGAAPGAKIVHVSQEQQLNRGWNAEYFGLPHADVFLACDSDTFVKAVVKKLGLPIPAFDKPAVTYRQLTESSPTQLSNRSIANTLNTATDGKDVCLIRLTLGWNGGYRDFAHPMDYLGMDGGGGIGSGPGMCVGAALALQGTGRIPIGVIGDGDFLMGVTSIWTACHYRIPLLLIVSNNNSFFNDEMHQERVAKERGRPVENRWIGQRMSDPDIDLAAIARAQGAIAWGPITDKASLEHAVAQGMQAVQQGKVCVIDVRVMPGYDTDMSGDVNRQQNTPTLNPQKRT